MELKPNPKKETYVTIAVTRAMKLELKAAAKKHNLTVSEFLRQLAKNFLESDFNSVEILQSRKSRKKGA